MTSSKQRLLHIDAIRGIAALLVVYMHVSEVFVHSFPKVAAHGTLLYDIAYRFDLGRVGVIAFFAISGFVICSSLKGSRTSGTLNFFVSRFLRLYPAFWFALLLAWFTRYWLNDRELPFDLLLANITMMPSLFGEKPLFGLFWTLEVELVFYGLCYLFFMLGLLHRANFLFLISCLLMCLFLWIVKHPSAGDMLASRFLPHWRYMPHHIAIMFWGGLFRLYYDSPRRKASLLGIHYPIWLMLIVLTALLLEWHTKVLLRGLEQGNDLLIRQGISYLAGFSLFLFFALVVKLRSRVFVWFGTVSYSIYITHPAIFLTVMWVLRKYAPSLAEFHLGVYLLFCLGATVALASLIYFLIERPAIGLSTYIRRRL